MPNKYITVVGTALLTLKIVSIATSANALDITPGNFLFSREDSVTEYTPNGSIVQSFSVPYPGNNRSESARDLVVDSQGKINIYNGTFDPVLSKLAPETGTINNTTFSGWSTVNNGSYGGITSFNDKIFVTDMETSGDGNTQGIVVFEGENASRFATDIEPIDINRGLNGLLYALSPGGSPSGRMVSVYDPTTLAKIRDINLTANTSTGFNQSRRSIAVNSSGELFVATFSGTIFHLDEAGNLLNSNNFSSTCSQSDFSCSFLDLDINPQGTLLLTSRFGAVATTDESLSSLNLLIGEDSSFDGRFATFVPTQNAAIGVPFEFSPTMGLILSLGLFGANNIRKRKLG